MKIWKDIFSGDPFASNEFTYMEVFDCAGLEINCRLLLTKKGGELAETTYQFRERQQKIDVVERFQLKEVVPKMEKPAWGTYIKDYVKRVKTHLERER